MIENIKETIYSNNEQILLSKKEIKILKTNIKNMYGEKNYERMLIEVDIKRIETESVY